jgi:hypothetical protein
LPKLDTTNARGQLGMAQHALVPAAVEHDVLVHLVGEQQHAGVAHDRLERLDVAGIEHRAGRVVRAVDHQQARVGADGGADAVPVHREIDRVQRHVHRAAAGQVDRRLVAVVARVEHHDFLARPHHREHRVEDGLAAAAGHGDLGIGIDRAAVAAQRLRGDGLAQRRHAGHRRVLVAALAHRLRERVDQRRGHVEIGEALAQVDGLVLERELRHHGEDGGADLRQLRRREHGGGSREGAR